MEDLIKELEELKNQITKNEKKKEKERKRKKKWQVLAGIEGALLILSIILLCILLLKDEPDTKETFLDANNNPNVISGEKQNSIQKETFKHIEDLEETIGAVNLTAHSFTASVQELYGYEYLCFTNKKLSIYYRNEFDEIQDDQRQKIVIDNGKKRVELDWEYDLTKDLADLCPYIGDYAKDGNMQLMFVIYDSKKSDFKNKIYKELRFIDTTTLWEYDVLDLHEELISFFLLSYEEETTSATQEKIESLITCMNMRISGTNYKYQIKEGTYANALYHEENPLNVTDNITLTINEDEITLLSVITIEGKEAISKETISKEYLGQFTASIGVDGRDYSLQNVKYGAYVKANQEDMDLEGIIIPRTTPISDYVTIYGNLGERFIIEKSSVLKRFSYDLKNILTDEKGIKTYYANETPASVMGIDVSKYQGNIDWKKVKAAGVEYAFIRIGYRGMNRGVGNGNLEYDEYFKKNIKEALEAGIDVGVYFFSQAITIEEAIEEADFVINGLKGYNITYPVVFDTEAAVINGYSARANDLTRQQRTDITKTFCETIEAAGYQPMIYANTKWMIMGIDLEQLDKYPRWFAYYGDNFAFPYDVQIWQYSDSGKISGISGNVDLNISFVDNFNLN